MTSFLYTLLMLCRLGDLYILFCLSLLRLFVLSFRFSKRRNAAVPLSPFFGLLTIESTRNLDRQTVLRCFFASTKCSSCLSINFIFIIFTIFHLGIVIYSYNKNILGVTCNSTVKIIVCTFTFDLPKSEFFIDCILSIVGRFYICIFTYMYIYLCGYIYV